MAIRSEAAVGLRPGYSYRLEVNKVGDGKTRTIYPSIEVRGSLIPRPALNVAEHPVPIILTDDDITRILEGRYLSKIYYLEDPEKAVNPVVPGVPVEITAASESDAIKEARLNGRIMIVFRVGERSFSVEELARDNVPGTIVAPGMKSWPVPAAPPHLPFGAIPLYDPRFGPAAAGGQECLYDGGDSKRPLGIGNDNKVHGLDASDTAMEFTTPRGKKVTSSNRVCICVPRFAAMRTELSSSSHQVLRSTQSSVLTRPPVVFLTKVPPQSVVKMEQPIGALGQIRASGTIGEQIPITTATLIGKLSAIYSVKGTKSHVQLQETEDITTFCDALILQKLMDPPHPKRIGEIVTFTLRYYNPTNQPMTDVVVSDSLTGRLEYIDGSAKSDRAATFTAIANEAGSLILRWAVDGPLLPGQRGNISFKARIK